MKEIFKEAAILLLILSIIPIFFFGAFVYMGWYSEHPEIYETNSVVDYGSITGNYDNETPREFIFSFFPQYIDESFSEVTYHYSAKKFDAYAYEAYLEIMIQDKIAFTEFLEQYVDEKECVPFLYDESFVEVSVSNRLYLMWPENETEALYIGDAEIGKILYSVAQQRIIFFAMGVYDGGGTRASELSYFVDRFGIDWAEFEQASDPQPVYHFAGT